MTFRYATICNCSNKASIINIWIYIRKKASEVQSHHMIVMSIDDLITTVSSINGTTPSCDDSNNTPLYWGYITAAIAVICYGTTPTPIKRTHTGNGMFFQWIFGLSTGLYALVIQQIRGNPKFYLLPMLGGVSFITANLTVVPVMKMIGLALMISIRGVTNLLSGWATGRFGLFGLKSDPPDDLLLNDIGVILAVFSTVIFAFVKNEVSTSGIDKTETVTFDVSDTQTLLQVQKGSSYSVKSYVEDSDMTNDKSFIDNFSPNVKRIGIGLCFLDIVWKCDNKYCVFSHVCSIHEKSPKSLSTCNNSSFYYGFVMDYSNFLLVCFKSHLVRICCISNYHNRSCCGR
ncbi:hypothetical protein ACF0H5_011081 [Mactra antiquata]